MISIIAGIVCLALSIYQIFSTRNLFNFVKMKGNERTSSFFLLGLWSSIVFSGAIFLIGLYLIFVLSSIF